VGWGGWLMAGELTEADTEGNSALLKESSSLHHHRGIDPPSFLLTSVAYHILAMNFPN
jgi:hypothetical protein